MLAVPQIWVHFPHTERGHVDIWLQGTALYSPNSPQLLYGYLEIFTDIFCNLDTPQHLMEGLSLNTISSFKFSI